MSAAPLISVIITSYNYRRFITQAIDSARGQTYPNVEIVVVDNASTDGTVPELRERYRTDPRVRIFENAENIGEVRNSLRGFELSQGEFISCVSADDWILPRHLARLHDVFRANPGLDVVHSGCYFADESGRVYALRQMLGQLPFDYVDARDELIEMVTTTCPVCWPAALFRRSALLDVGPMKDPAVTAGDWEMQVRLAVAGKRFAYLDEPSTVIRLHGGQSSGDAYLEAGTAVGDLLAILEKYVDDPRFVARLRGRELGIAAFVDTFTRVQEAAAGRALVTPALTERIERLRAVLRARAAAYEPARARERRISVIVPMPQSMQAAARALASVGRQSHGNWEIVAVDHGPLPFGEWLRGHPLWERMSYVRSEESLTPGRARNLGLRLARGEYLAFLDEDNTYAPNHLEALVETIERTGASAAAASARCVLESGDTTMQRFEELAAPEVFGSQDEAQPLAVAPSLPLNAVLFYRHLLDRMPPFEEQWWLLEDYAYLLGIERAGSIARSPAVTVDVRVRIEMNHALGAYLGQYVAYLDAVYRAFPVNPALTEARRAQRAAVEQAIAQVHGRSITLAQLGDLLRTLAGRRVEARTA